MIKGSRIMAVTRITPKIGEEFLRKHYSHDTADRAQAPLISTWGEENVRLAKFE